MKKSELINSINAIIINGNKICKESKGMVSDGVLKRLEKAKVALKLKKLDAIEYRDLFSIYGENEYKSYKDLRESKGSSLDIIKDIRPLSVCVYNADNNYKGEYIRIN